MSFVIVQMRVGIKNENGDSVIIRNIQVKQHDTQFHLGLQNIDIEYVTIPTVSFNIIYSLVKSYLFITIKNNNC